LIRKVGVGADKAWVEIGVYDGEEGSEGGGDET
jgi:hypothetical protein